MPGDFVTESMSELWTAWQKNIPPQVNPRRGRRRASAAGADNGNRTRLVGLGSRSSTDKLCPQILYIIHYAAGFVNIIIDNFWLIIYNIGIFIESRYFL